MDKVVNLTINGVAVKATENETILEAAKKLSLKIPTLCHLKGVVEHGNCRVCVVEVEGRKNLVTACNTKVLEGMKIVTNSEEVLNARKTTIELMLSNHQKDCLSCGKNLKCDLQKLSAEFRCDEHKFKGKVNNFEIDKSSPSLVRDNNKCILCGRCVAVCKKIQATSAIAKQERGFNTYVGCAYDKPLSESTCVGCGQCVLVCPTGALLEVSDVNKVLELLNNKNNTLIAQVAPSVRVAIAEEFGHEIGTFTEGKIATALKLIGFNKVFDVNTGADFTVVEESEELIDRIQKNENLPLFSSCCPSWFNYLEKHYPEMQNNLSTCKTPNEMLGSLIKNYYAKRENLNNVKVVSIMPCISKKGEIIGNDDVDVVLTTRELAYLIKLYNIDFNSLPDTPFDNPLGEYSGAGLIFGASGGVTEAVLRTALEKITGKQIDNCDYKVVRAVDGIKEVLLSQDGVTLNLCVVSGLNNANNVLKQIKTGEKHYHFVEVMACPGGCVNGGGQPYVNYDNVDVNTVIKKRTNAIYNADKNKTLRKSHNNEFVVKIYKEFFKGDKHLQHEILHYKNKCKKLAILSNSSYCDCEN